MHKKLTIILCNKYKRKGFHLLPGKPLTKIGFSKKKYFLFWWTHTIMEAEIIRTSFKGG